MDRVFQSALPIQNHVSIPVQEHAATLGVSIPLPLQFISAGSRVPPITPAVDITDSSFPTGTFTAGQFCSVMFRWSEFQSVPIKRIDWLEKDSWPLYHQYLLFEIAYNDQLYRIRVETLGRIDRHRTTIETLALNAFGPGFLGNSKVQVQVSKQTEDLSETNLLDRCTPRANLLVSMAGLDDLLFDQLSDRNNWHFTSVIPPDYSEAEDREPPKVEHLCRILWAFIQQASDYDVRAQNCYFLCRTIVLALSGLCAPLPGLTWTLRTEYLYPCVVVKVPWYRLLWSPTSWILSCEARVLYVDGRPAEHLHQIAFHELRDAVISTWRVAEIFITVAVVMVVVIIVSEVLMLRSPKIPRPVAFIPAIFTVLLILALTYYLQRSESANNMHNAERHLERVRNLVLEDIGLLPPTRWSISPNPFSNKLGRIGLIPTPGVPLYQSLLLLPAQLAVFVIVYPFYFIFTTARDRIWLRWKGYRSVQPTGE